MRPSPTRSDPSELALSTIGAPANPESPAGSGTTARVRPPSPPPRMLRGGPPRGDGRGRGTILEARIPFTREISVIAARGRELGATVAFEGPGENVHEAGIQQ